MTELLKLLDRSIPDVKTGINGLSREDLQTLHKAETDGKSRAGVLELLNAALAEEERTAAGIDAATEFEASGAPHQVPGVDLNHPAVDTDPRANTTPDQNRIDFNDPTLTDQEAVDRNLANQA